MKRGTLEWKKVSQCPVSCRVVCVEFIFLFKKCSLYHKDIAFQLYLRPLRCIIACLFVSDHIFDQSSTNQEIFSTVVKPIVDAAIQGFNGTIFAYGQTSSGNIETFCSSYVNTN